jgi:hypothetical protein
MTNEDARLRLRTKPESAFGAEEASILMDRPPGGWNDLVTNQMLEARLDALKHEFVAAMERGFRTQTWRLLGAIFVAFGLFATLARIT